MKSFKAVSTFCVIAGKPLGILSDKSCDEIGRERPLLEQAVALKHIVAYFPSESWFTLH